jgi:hypothetical protein
MRTGTIGRTGCVWLVAFAASMVLPSTQAAQAPAATPPTARITAQTPSRPDALTPTEFAAIVNEAASVPRNVPPNGGILLPKSWHSLTRDKLAAMLTMPRLGEIPHFVRQVLIDQAATWDLFDYKRPSDAAELWGRVWSVDVKYQSAWDFFTYIPDATWSPTSLAMASVFKCFPRTVWTSTNPVVDAVEHNYGWVWDQGRGAAGMGDCLPDVGGSYVQWTPSLRAQVSDILTRKFSAELLEDGCTRNGPDSCLLVFQALYGLDPHASNLPALLRKMQPSFFGPEPSGWTFAGKDDSALKVADALRTQLTQRLAFITAELPVLLDHPDAWPDGETERALGDALHASIRLYQLQQLDFRRYYYRADRDLINPWHWLSGARGQQVAPIMRSLGQSVARTLGCQLGEPATKITQAFLYGYAIENIRLGNPCSFLRELPLAELIKAEPKRRKQLAALLQPIAKQLSEGGSLREDALNQVADACHAAHPAAPDPFGLCAGIRARDAAALAAMPKVDPLDCPEDTLAAAEQALSVQPAGDDYADCRKDPADTRHAIVALAYQANDGADDGDEDYDLDIAIVDLDSGDILAHRHEAKGIASDAVSLNRIWLDTARYDLAPGRRAFGIRSSNSAHCYQCAYGISTLSLYLANGEHIDKLLSTTAEEINSGNGNDYSSRTLLCVGPGRHHGLADIVASTGASCGKPDGDSRTWRYDGTKYVEEKNTR